MPQKLQPVRMFSQPICRPAARQPNSRPTPSYPASCSISTKPSPRNNYPNSGKSDPRESVIRQFRVESVRDHLVTIASWKCCSALAHAFGVGLIICVEYFSGDQLCDQFTTHVGESKVAALETIG